MLSCVIERAVMADAETIGATRLVLEPVNLAVYIARNLSPWYHQVPDIDVVGKLHAVKVGVILSLKNALNVKWVMLVVQLLAV